MADIAHVDRVTHLLVTDEGTYGLSGESPQVPGLCLGRPTQALFLQDYQAVLGDIGVHGKVQVHKQVRGQTADGREYLFRWADGSQTPERLEVVRRIEGVLGTAQAGALLDTATTPMGEVVLVAALPSDELGSFIDQMYTDADAIVICAAIADQGLFSITLAIGRQDAPGWESLEEQGWSRETTISQLLREWAVGHRPARLLV